MLKGSADQPTSWRQKSPHHAFEDCVEESTSWKRTLSLKSEIMESPYDQSFPILFSLPLEIFQHITTFLEPSDLTCLGLSCTGLWSHVAVNTIQGFRQKDAYWLKQRDRLLLELAKDSADMIYCDICLKLQPLHYGRALTVSNKWIRPPCHHLASHVSICKHFSVTREMLELGLKFQGNVASKSSSLPDPFAHTCTWRTSGSGSSEFVLEITSRVVEKALYLKVVYEVDVKLDTKRNFKTPSMRGKGCLHSGMWLKEKSACALQHAAKSELLCASCARSQRCAYCFTDFLVSAAKKSTSSLHLQVRAYKYLGGGQAGSTTGGYGWVAQTRPLSIAKKDKVNFYSKFHSLEYIFEHRARQRFIDGRDVGQSPAARIAWFEKH